MGAGDSGSFAWHQPQAPGEANPRLHPGTPARAALAFQ